VEWGEERVEDQKNRLQEEGWVESSRILDKNMFFCFLDLEVKRARRYQNFLCLLHLKIKQFSESQNGWSFETCYQTLSDLLTVEMRESDIIGSIGVNQLVVLLPYADELAGYHAKSRFASTLKYFDFGGKGYEVTIDQISFPMNGTDAMDLIMDLIKKTLGTEIT
jgi:GGDEF domain-containing protein